MTTFTIRLPDEIGARIKDAAATRGVSVNRWVVELSRQALTAQDTEAGFRAAQARADIPGTLAIFDRLDKEVEANRQAAAQTRKRSRVTAGH